MRMLLRMFFQRSFIFGVGEYRRISCFYYWACFYIGNAPIMFYFESPFRGTEMESGKFTSDRKKLHLAKISLGRKFTWDIK